MNLINIIDDNNKKETISCLGIDFGTTNSVCSIKKKDKIVFVKDNKNKKIIPSIVYYNKGNILVGNDVEKEVDFSKIIFSIKRLFTDNPDKKLDVNHLSEQKSPVEISKEIFSHIKVKSYQFFNEDISDCVLTVPAYFDERARSGIMRAAFLAGLNVRRLINEPTAAAFAYGLEKKKRGIFLVFDLGGGTFDISLLKLRENVFKVLGTSGDANLGGDDFDLLFAEKILKDFFESNLQNLNKDEKVGFLKECKSFKEKLLKEDNVTKEITINKKTKNVILNEKILNESVKELVEKTITITRNLISESEVELDSIDGFILVGGSTRLKLIKKKIKESFKKKIFDELDPDLVVSHGAALHGYELLNGSQHLLLDVTPLSLGIETMGGLMEKIIPRNTSIPCIKEQSFTTNENGQTSIKIRIIQGERETISDNTILGEFILSGLEPKSAGIPRIKVRFSLDVDGILFVSAFDESSSQENSLVVKTSNDLSINEMREIVESSISNAQKDMDLRLLIESKVKATKFMNEVNNVKTEIKDLCSKNEVENINKIIKMMKITLKSDNKEKIDNLIEELNECTKKFAQLMIDKNFSSFVGKKVDELE